MAESTSSGSSLGFLKHKIGPVPIWIICVGAVAAYYWYVHYGPGATKKAAAAQAATQASSGSTVDPATGQTYASELANLQAQLNAAQSDTTGSSQTTVTNNYGQGQSRWRNQGTTTSPTQPTPPTNLPNQPVTPTPPINTPTTPTQPTPPINTPTTPKQTGTKTGTGNKIASTGYSNPPGESGNWVASGPNANGIYTAVDGTYWVYVDSSGGSYPMGWSKVSGPSVNTGVKVSQQKTF